MNESTPAEPVLEPSADAESEIRPINLKNPVTALVLAWLFPGLGHLYQGRTAKGILFAVALLPLLVAGVWMGSYWRPSPVTDASGGAVVSASGESTEELLVGRCGYFSWRQGDKRLYFIPQAANAAVAVPALIQAHRVSQGKEPFFYGAFAPPRLASEKNNQPTLNELLLALDSWFDLGTIFLAVAGLLNILVMFDAFAGPAWVVKPEKEDASEEKAE